MTTWSSPPISKVSSAPSRNKLKDRKPRQTLPPKRIASLLRDNVQEITSKVLEGMKSDPQLGQLRLSDNQRVDHVPKMIAAMADSLESNHGNISVNCLHAVFDLGKLR